jgi:hypothetical protein
MYVCMYVRMYDFDFTKKLLTAINIKLQT